MFLHHTSLKPGKQAIISLVPSQTELLFDLGLDEEVIGITKFCIHPPHWHKEKAKVGGTKTLNIDKIKSLHPTLIIANKEENVRDQVESFQDIPVWLTDVNNLQEACSMITDIGRLTNTTATAEKLTNEIAEKFETLAQDATDIDVAYLIWKDPIMTVGGDNFIHDMLTRTGMRNVFGSRSRYPTVTIDEIVHAGCRLLLLSTEPYPFKQKDIDALSMLLPGVMIRIVDGEMFSWYGSRLLKSVEYFKELQFALSSR